MESLECTICRDFFTDPRVLPCGHTFCLKCINFVQPTCPLCHSHYTSQPTHLPSNNTLNQILKTFKRHHPTLCKICQNPAFKYCPKCKAMLCGSCLEIHQTGIFTKEHPVVDSISAEVCKECQLHQKSLKMYCEKCLVQVCSVCFRIEHLKHEECVLPIAEVARKRRRKVSSIVTANEENYSLGLKDIVQVEKELQEVKHSIEELKTKQEKLEQTKLKMENSNVILKNHIDAIKRIPLEATDIMDDVKFEVILGISNLSPLFKMKIDTEKESEICGIAVLPNGNIVVTDRFHNRVKVFLPNGKLVKEFGEEGSGDGQLKGPRGVAVDRLGNIVVADFDNKRIQVFDIDGNFIRKFGCSGAFGVAIQSNGDIVVSDLHGHQIQVFESNGKLIHNFGSKGSDDGQFNSPTCVSIDQQGNIIVSDGHNHRVQVFESNGKFIRKFGAKGSEDGLLEQPCGVTVRPNGNIVVADWGNHRIQVFGSDGKFICKFGSKGFGDGQFDFPWGVAIGATGNILVTDLKVHQIKFFITY